MKFLLQFPLYATISFHVSYLILSASNVEDDWAYSIENRPEQGISRISFSVLWYLAGQELCLLLYDILHNSMTTPQVNESVFNI